MEHQMKLYEDPFSRIKSGQKRIEVRLFDEKRSLIRPRDIIVFSKLPDLGDKLPVTVRSLHRYQSFQDLVSDFPMSAFGYPDDYNPAEFIRECHEIYSPEQERELGVLGIGIRSIKNQ